jgi:hypothetical protein
MKSGSNPGPSAVPQAISRASSRAIAARAMSSAGDRLPALYGATICPDGGVLARQRTSVCGPYHTQMRTPRGYRLRSRPRREAGIQNVLPPGFLPDRTFDKWRNQLLSGGTRVAGPLEGLLKATGKSIGRSGHGRSKEEGSATPRSRLSRP